jgi:hypothetical protein
VTDRRYKQDWNKGRLLIQDLRISVPSELNGLTRLRITTDQRLGTRCREMRDARLHAERHQQRF